MHLLVLGQSNVGNHCETRSRSDWGRVHLSGALHPLHDPLPGCSGKSGSVWTRFAQIPGVRSRLGDFVVTNLSQGGTSSADWASADRFQPEVKKQVSFAAEMGLPVTHVLYHQGERDTLLETSATAYQQNFRRLYTLLRALVPEAPIILCRASYRMGVTSQAVISAQSELSETLENVVPGPDTDQFGSDMRCDDTHWNETGAARFAEALEKTFAGLQVAGRPARSRAVGAGP